ncbi:MAG: hypothetical protein ABJ242_07070 [Marinomonas sp.]
MRFAFATAAILSAITAGITPAGTIASAEARTLARPALPAPPPITANPAMWLTVKSEIGQNYVHMASGAICSDQFRGLTLVAITDYAPDGTNSSCQYDMLGGKEFQRMTLYVYTAEGLTGPIAYKGAKQAIGQINETSAITVTERKEEGQQCHRGVIKPLAESILGRMKKEGSEGQEANLGLGLAMYDYSIPARGERPAQEQTSLLSVYQTGKWIVKTRVTMDKTENSYETACNYGGITSVAMARVITRGDAPAYTPEG